MDSSETGRPAKKAKLERSEEQKESKARPKWHRQKVEFARQQRRNQLEHPQPESSEHKRDRELFGIDEDDDKEIGLEPLHEEEREKLRKIHIPKMFSQPSVIATGDKGIFVTCDKGKEKKSLSDLADLVDDYLEERGFIPAELIDPDALLQSRLKRQQKKTATIAVDNEESPVEEEEIDIESSINAELSGMKSSQGGPTSISAKGAPTVVRAFQLITLDIPCVSFLRFIPKHPMFDKVDVVDLVVSICVDAAKNPGRMRSRFIRRLSPIVWLGKALSGGLEKACDETLPAHFKIDQTDGQTSETVANPENEGGAQATMKGVKFAIRPTIRNSTKISRGDVIEKVADAVQKHGNNGHKVDLKGYEKGVLVEVYRGWVGMSVVDNTSTQDSQHETTEEKSGHTYGYEALKKFNLAEIYAAGMKQSADTAG